MTTLERSAEALADKAGDGPGNDGVTITIAVRWIQQLSTVARAASRKSWMSTSPTVVLMRTVGPELV